jgi:CRP/FNR family transcriptional regulator, cyclic AMP receptor protein
MRPAPKPLDESCLNCSQRSLRLFCNLDEHALRAFDQIGAHLSLAGRAILFDEGDRPNGIFVICSGRVKLSCTSRDGRTMILRIADSGDVLGLSAALGKVPYEVTAETLEPTRLKRIGLDEFTTFLAAYPISGANAAKTLAREYRATFFDARRLALAGSAPAKIANVLLDWATTESCGQTRLRFTMALTHEELANLAGTSRETVTRSLNRFERDGLIARRGSSITVTNLAELSHMASR